MKFRMCSIRDEVAEAWMKPLCFRSDAEAVRSFSDAVQNPESDFYKHPQDFALFHVAMFDELSGEVEAEPQPGLLIQGMNCRVIGESHE